jgi:hypothetical protein
MVNKKIDLGEYVVKVAYNDITGQLDVSVFDELEDVIESIHITNDEDDDNDNDNDNDIEIFNLN